MSPKTFSERRMETFAFSFCCRFNFGCIFLILFQALLIAQESIKYEKEALIDAAEVPAKALYTVEQMKLEKVKWVKELNLNNQSFEAKAIWGKFPVSIEFDNQGFFEDIEIDIRFSSLEKEVRNAVRQHLKSFFLKHRIEKVQRQWSGDVKSVIEMVNSQTVSPEVLERFEIEVYALLKKQWRYFELLFEKDGSFVSKREIDVREHKYEAF